MERIAYSMNPNDPRVLAVYGEILVRNNKTKLGIELLKKTLELRCYTCWSKKFR